MREIKFRGLRVDGVGWVYGVQFEYKPENACFIIDCMATLNFTTKDTSFYGHKVHQKSVGQYTGLKDKNGVDIYEGDIVFKYYGSNSVKERLRGAKGVVEFGTYDVIRDDWDITHVATGWHMEFDDGSGAIAVTPEFEIIGNIHQNPELLSND